MAEEPKNINSGLEKIQLNRILKQIKEGQEDGAKAIGAAVRVQACIERVTLGRPPIST